MVTIEVNIVYNQIARGTIIIPDKLYSLSSHAYRAMSLIIYTNMVSMVRASMYYENPKSR